MRSRVSAMFAVLLFASSRSFLPGAAYDPAFDAGVVSLRKDVGAFFDAKRGSTGEAL